MSNNAKYNEARKKGFRNSLLHLPEAKVRDLEAKHKKLVEKRDQKRNNFRKAILASKNAK